MGTIRGRSIKFKSEHEKYPQSDPTISWEYNTTSDTLSITWKFPDRRCAYTGRELEGYTKTDVYDVGTACGLAKCLIDWYGSD